MNYLSGSTLFYVLHIFNFVFVKINYLEKVNIFFQCKKFPCSCFNIKTPSALLLPRMKPV